MDNDDNDRWEDNSRDELGRLWEWVVAGRLQRYIEGVAADAQDAPAGWTGRQLVNLDQPMGNQIRQLFEIGRQDPLTVETFVDREKLSMLKAWMAMSHLEGAERLSPEQGRHLCGALGTQKNCDRFGVPRCSWRTNFYDPLGGSGACKWVAPRDERRRGAAANPEADNTSKLYAKVGTAATVAATALGPWLALTSALGASIWGQKYIKIQERWRDMIEKRPKQLLDDLWMLYTLTHPTGDGADRRPMCMARMRPRQPGLWIKNRELRERLEKMLADIHAAIQGNMPDGQNMERFYKELHKNLIYVGEGDDLRQLESTSGGVGSWLKKAFSSVVS